ncbi:class A beta-lactamase [Sphingomonas sp. AX6]|uniref:class A beta-lactamase n=1 Tax=Sphingomonas sp. AX6 TaxID=2653171 RepID=UPI0012F2EA6A|nr:class A beta-lactamase [Sphingomonas sp. AX6]VXC99558.1 Beta-lactamase [Sphingomonas sp. AX6]
MDRRTMLSVIGASAVAACAMPRGGGDDDAELAAIAAEVGGRLGVHAFDTTTSAAIGIDAGSRYAMCSTFKAPLAAAILTQVDAGTLHLDQSVRFTRADLVPYAPVVEAALDRGELSVEALCKGAVEISDNVAANLLLALIGGPAGFTRFVRARGDAVTRLDRIEPELNLVRGGDVRDTTTPAAMVGLMGAVLTGKLLTPASRDRLIGWMVASPTGRERLRSGFPADWRAGDKTGTSGEGYFNDIAIMWPPDRAPILVACYLDAPGLDPEAANAAHAKVGALIARRFA